MSALDSMLAPPFGVVAQVVVKTTILLLAALAGTRVLRRAPAAARHLVWVSALAGVLLVPLVSRVTTVRLALLPSALTAPPLSPGGGREGASPEVVASTATKRSASGAAPAVGTPQARSSAPGAEGRHEPLMGSADMPASVQKAQAGAVGALPAVPASSVQFPFHAATLAVAIWSAVGIALLARLVTGLLSLRTILRGARDVTTDEWTLSLRFAADRLGIATLPRLVESDRVAMACVCGVANPTIILPADAASWDLDCRRAVLLHELAHMKRRDVLSQALARAASVVYWFNPLVWIAARQLRVESERACDDVVLSAGMRASDYAQELLGLAIGIGRAAAPAAALPILRRRELDLRVDAILDPSASRSAIGRRAALAVSGPILLLAATVGAASPVRRQEVVRRVRQSIGTVTTTLRATLDRHSPAASPSNPGDPAALAARPLDAKDRPSGEGLTIHEWGTFTTVAGADGRAVAWYPLGGPTDLPCFVQRFQNRVGIVQTGPVDIVPAQFEQGSPLDYDALGQIPSPVRNVFAVSGPGRDGQFQATGNLAAPSLSPAEGKFAGVVVTRASFDYGATRAHVRAKVRMETPVLYFYAPTDMTADVRVDFPRGLMTEWYPHAVVTQGDVETRTLDDTTQAGTILWRHVAITPGARPVFPAGDNASHYFAARATDASPIVVDGQAEKFLFYRGIANFDVPLSAEVLERGAVRITNLGRETLPGAMVFASRGGKLGFRLAGPLPGGGTTTLDQPPLTGDFETLRGALEHMLVGAGLYPKEAAAMVETWRGSWFEDGVRVFYLMPGESVNRVLPLTVHPAPVDTQRVFVGRMELVTPEVQSAVERAVAANDTAAIERADRFFGAIADRILAKSADPVRTQHYKELEDGLLTSYVRRASVCER